MPIFSLTGIHPYQNIDVLLATKHKKDQAICPSFSKVFNANIIVPEDFDTDKYGTFSGEAPREDYPDKVVFTKAEEAALRYDFDYVIASEGSFGSHHTIPFCALNCEYICFIDRKRKISVLESEVTINTNFEHLDINSTTNYELYLKRIKFPSHSVLVRCPEDNCILAKGINNIHKLNVLIKAAFKKYGILTLETDMRAMMNPTRMKVISKLSEKLVQRLQQYCPSCYVPGFGKVTYKDFLLCKLCRSETSFYRFKVLNCIKCDYYQICSREDGLEEVDPQYCLSCNP